MESSHLIAAWDSLLKSELSLILKVACKLDLNPGLFFVTDVADATGTAQLGNALTKNQLEVKLKSTASKSDVAQLNSAPWLKRSSKSKLLSLARFVARAYVFRTSIATTSAKIVQIKKSFSDEMIRRTYEPLILDNKSELSFIASSHGMENVFLDSFVDGFNSGLIEGALYNSIRQQTAKLVLFELVGRSMHLAGTRVTMAGAAERAATQIILATEMAKNATPDSNRAHCCKEPYSALLDKLRKVNMEAYIIAKNNEDRKVRELRFDLLAGWHSSRLNSRYLMLTHLVDENTGRVFMRKEDILFSIIKNAPPTWGRFVGSTTERVRRATYTHRRSLSKTSDKKLQASRKIMKRQEDLQKLENPRKKSRKNRSQS
jgi:hypothetical protein